MPSEHLDPGRGFQPAADGPDGLHVQGALREIRRQKALVLDDRRDQVSLLRERLRRQVTDTEHRRQGRVLQRDDCIGKAQVGQHLGRRIAEHEDAMPPADLHGAQLRVEERLPGREGGPTQDPVVPGEQLQIVFLAKLAQRIIPVLDHPGFAVDVPHLRDQRNDAEMAVDVGLRRAVAPRHSLTMPSRPMLAHAQRGPIPQQAIADYSRSSTLHAPAILARAWRML